VRRSRRKKDVLLSVPISTQLHAVAPPPPPPTTPKQLGPIRIHTPYTHTHADMWWACSSFVLPLTRQDGYGNNFPLFCFVLPGITMIFLYPFSFLLEYFSFNTAKRKLCCTCYCVLTVKTSKQKGETSMKRDRERAKK
jgi:hypothetical protein